MTQLSHFFPKKFLKSCVLLQNLREQRQCHLQYKRLQLRHKRQGVLYITDADGIPAQNFLPYLFFLPQSFEFKSRLQSEQKRYCQAKWFCNLSGYLAIRTTTQSTLLYHAQNKMRLVRNKLYAFTVIRLLQLEICSGIF